MAACIWIRLHFFMHCQPFVFSVFRVARSERSLDVHTFAVRVRGGTRDMHDWRMCVNLPSTLSSATHLWCAHAHRTALVGHRTSDFISVSLNFFYRIKAQEQCCNFRTHLKAVIFHTGIVKRSSAKQIGCSGSSTGSTDSTRPAPLARLARAAHDVDWWLTVADSGRLTIPYPSQDNRKVPNVTAINEAPPLGANTFPI